MRGARCGFAPVVALAGALAIACGETERSGSAGELEAVAITDQAGAVCGMLVRDQSAPRAQVIHRDGERAFLCSVGDLLAYLDVPSPHGAPAKVLIEVMEPSEDPARSHTGPHPWISAEDGVYVIGVERKGIMGAPVLVYRDRAPAEPAGAGRGARILGFDELRRWWKSRQSGIGLRGTFPSLPLASSAVGPRPCDLRGPPGTSRHRTSA